MKTILNSHPFTKRLLRLIARYKYPDWTSFIQTNSNLWQQSLSNSSSGPKILISTTIGIHPSVVIFEGYLGLALTLRGARVHFLHCDGFLPGCQVTSFKDVKILSKKGNPPPRLCNKCFYPGYKSIKSIGLPIHKYSDFISPSEINQVKEINSTILPENIPHYKLGEMALGEHTLSGTLKFFARGDLENEKYAKPILNQYFLASLLTTTIFKNMLNKHKFQSAVFHHGIYVPEGIIGAVCRQQQVKVINWNPAYRKRSFIFSHYDTYHHTLMSEPTEKWENIPWGKQLETETMNYLDSRVIGVKDWISFVSKNPEKDLIKIKQELGGAIDFTKPCIGMLTNVIWDAQLHYPANIFKNMVEWIIKTIQYFIPRKDLQLIIRIHPAEILGEFPSRQQVKEEIKKVFPVLPNNIFIVNPESKISTYKIMEQCNAVLIYGTKTGVELTARGIPVIVAGEAWIRNKGLTIDPQSQTEYFQILDRLPFAEKMSGELIQRARKYAFHFFFRRMIPIFQFELTGSIPPFRLNISRLEEMLPGNDPGLDVICDGILNGADFIYPAEELI